MHLGRPAFAYRALKMWKRSWLSREVLLFGCFSGIAGIYAALLWLQLPMTTVPGIMTALVGFAGVTASACIYLVRARPAWNTKHTLIEFYLTAALLGPLLVACLGVGDRRWLVAGSASAAGCLMLNLAGKFFWMTASDSFELRASARLLSTALASRIIARSFLLLLGGIVLPLAWTMPFVTRAAFALALAGEILGRYLFFVSVVPKNMAASYLSASKVAP